MGERKYPIILTLPIWGEETLLFRHPLEVWVLPQLVDVSWWDSGGTLLGGPSRPEMGPLQAPGSLTLTLSGLDLGGLVVADGFLQPPWRPPAAHLLSKDLGMEGTILAAPASGP